MRVVYTPRHWLHHPSHEALAGVQQPIYETPDRIEHIRAALERDGGLELCQLTEHGRQPIEAVHDPALIRFLETAWQAWQAIAPASEILPDTVLHPALREGMAPLREPNGVLAQLGYWGFDTATPIVAGTYTAARAAVDVALTTADLVLGGERCGLRAVSTARPSRAAGRIRWLLLLQQRRHHRRVPGATHQSSQSPSWTSISTTATARSRSSTAAPTCCTSRCTATRDYAYPYFAGSAQGTGTADGLGATLNVPLPSGTADAEYLHALERGLERVADSGGSTLLVSLGFDTYVHDPICDFALTTPVYHEIGRRVAALDRKVVVLQEGGYFVPQLGENARQWLRGLDRAAT